MAIMSAILAYSVAVALLTITPGLDTALVLRTAAIDGGKNAMLAGGGIAFGSLTWGIVTALGLGALLAVSKTAYFVLQVAGAAYLFYLAIGMLKDAIFPNIAAADLDVVFRNGGRTRRWFLRGLTTNLLNPKVGVFYVSFLPQFVPSGVNVVLFVMLLAAIHALMGIAWFALLTAATRPLSRALKKPIVIRALDGLTGGILIAFGLHLAFGRRIA